MTYRPRSSSSGEAGDVDWNRSCGVSNRRGGYRKRHDSMPMFPARCARNGCQRSACERSSDGIRSPFWRRVYTPERTNAAWVQGASRRDAAIGNGTSEMAGTTAGVHGAAHGDNGGYSRLAEVGTTTAGTPPCSGRRIPRGCQRLAGGASEATPPVTGTKRTDPARGRGPGSTESGGSRHAGRICLARQSLGPTLLAAPSL